MCLHQAVPTAGKVYCAGVCFGPDGKLDSVERGRSGEWRSR